MTVELSVGKTDGKGFYSTSIDLPAMDLALEDAKHSARFFMYPEAESYLDIYESSFGDMENVQMSGTSLEELNFLAKRLASLSLEDAVVFDAVYQSRVEAADGADFYVKDIINMTYGLDTVPVAVNVRNDYELGRFYVENSFDERFDDLPEEILKYLDYKAIGKEFRERDDGVFIGNLYIATRDYEQQEVYDGEHIPSSVEDKAVFKLLVAKAPENDPAEVLKKAKPISLPMKPEQLDAIAKELGADDIHNCVFYDFQSALPQIDAEMVGSMENIDKLNELAASCLRIGNMERLKFKAAMEAENVTTLQGAIDAIFNRDNYKYSFADENADNFFKTYLAHHAPTNFDCKWLDGIAAHQDAERLVQRLGAQITSYGIVSNRNGELFDLVDYDEPVTETIEPERYELIEILGRKALFSNGRIPDDEVPEGLYRYDFREDNTMDDIYFGSVEPNVTVNHAGSFLTNIPIDFGEAGYIGLNYDTEPNFLGEDMTVDEFVAADFSEDTDESMSISY